MAITCGGNSGTAMHLLGGRNIEKDKKVISSKKIEGYVGKKMTVNEFDKLVAKNKTKKKKKHKHKHIKAK